MPTTRANRVAAQETEQQRTAARERGSGLDNDDGRRRRSHSSLDVPAYLPPGPSELAHNIAPLRSTQDLELGGDVEGDDSEETSPHPSRSSMAYLRPHHQSYPPLGDLQDYAESRRERAGHDTAERQNNQYGKRKHEAGGNTESDPFLVEWSPDDPTHPRNWSNGKKWVMVAWACFMELGISFASSAYSSGSTQIQEEFGLSEPVVVLGLTTFIAGLGLGSLVLAPTSENFGRNTTYFVSFFIFALFQLPVALAPNLATILVCRFIAGFAGSVPLTVTGGTVGDVFAKDDSGTAVGLFALAGTAGPALGPVVSGWIALKKGWRWIFWVNFIVWMVVWLGTLLTLRETKADILIQRRAQQKRKETGDERYYAEIEKQRRGFFETFASGITKPIKLLCTEAVIICMSLYNGYIYGLLYLYFEAYPLVFVERHGFNEGELGLAYIPIIIGTVLAFLAHRWQDAFYLKRKKANGDKPVPEARLAWALFGGPIFAASLFWFAFTTYGFVPWEAPLFAGIPFGFGLMIIYMAAVSFVTESYSTEGASALAAVSLVRSGMGAGFPIFATGMYHQLGYQWAGLLIALLAVVMSFMAPVFYVYGAKIRAKSPHSGRVADKERAAMRAAGLSIQPSH